MAFTADLATDIGKVRMLLTDVDSANPLFPNDTQIQAFLDLELQDIKHAAALALETIASNRIMTLMMVQLLDLKVDSVTFAKSLMDTAKRLREYDNDDWCGFDWAEITDNSLFTLREKYTKLLIAGSL